MSNKSKSETLRLKARRAALKKLEHRPELVSNIEVRQRIIRGSDSL